MTRGPSQFPKMTKRYVAAQMSTAKPAKHMRDKKKRPICLYILLRLLLCFMSPGKWFYPLPVLRLFPSGPLPLNQKPGQSQCCKKTEEDDFDHPIYEAQITDTRPCTIAFTNGAAFGFQT